MATGDKTRRVANNKEKFVFEKRAFIIPRGCIIAILLLGMVLISCDPASTPVPTPLPTDTPRPVPPAPTPTLPAVTVTWTPNVSDVEVGQEIAFIVETEGQNVQFRWSAINGMLSASEGSAVIYTAPDTEGVDIVTLEASNDGGTTVEHISFNVVARPTDAPTPQTAQLEITGIICKPRDDAIDL